METRLWNLYRFLEERTISGEKTTVADICDRFPEAYHLNAKQSNFTNCPRVYKDIDLINESPEVDKIIVKDSNDFHLGTEEEAKEYMDKLLMRANKLYKKYNNVLAKAKLDNQGKLVSNQDKPIDEDSKAERFHEAYV